MRQIFRAKFKSVVLAMAFATGGLLPGCFHLDPQPPQLGSCPSDASAIVILDNHGGFSHEGRRVALQADGSYTDTRYTDVIGDQKTERGTYSFDAEKRRLTLSSSQGKTEALCRVDYGGQRYWVWEQNAQRVVDPANAWFRQVSLRAEAL
jgi:hypothetical protein